MEREPAIRGDDITPLTKFAERLEEPVNVGVPFQQPPVEPADIAILTLRVVVALLRPAHLVAHEHHGRAG